MVAIRYVLFFLVRVSLRRCLILSKCANSMYARDHKIAVVYMVWHFSSVQMHVKHCVCTIVHRESNFTYLPVWACPFERQHRNTTHWKTLATTNVLTINAIERHEIHALSTCHSPSFRFFPVHSSSSLFDSIKHKMISFDSSFLYWK